MRLVGRDFKEEGLEDPSIKVFKREPLGSGVIIAELSYCYLNSGTILSS